MCFGDNEKAFDRLSKKIVKRAITKKEILEEMVKAVISGNEETAAKINVKFG